MRWPKRGEIWMADLNPTAGREQQGLRPTLVVSQEEFNRSGLCLTAVSLRAVIERVLMALPCR
jgi:mRNA-degrading endonuclease toxin of MazEF toxin-antitoxin module